MNDELLIEILELGPFFTNCYIIGDTESRKGMIIDPGSDADRIIFFVDKHNLYIENIVVTHGHLDHIGALNEIRKRYSAPVLIGEKDAIMLVDPGVNLSEFADGEISSGPPEGLLHEGDFVLVGKYRFQVLETPGHTPGSISLYGHGVVFSGDALFLGSIGRTDFPGSSYETLLNSIHKKLLTLPDDTIIYSGHGPDSTVGQEREFNPFLS
jgi:glyoxylase-like metal-dependent hydrolase (beta-lactamase superfamily II)